jgi:peptidoglycan/LPS O-acetylase OafA/YrhL
MVTLALSILFAMAVYRLVERPMMRRIGRAAGHTPRIGGRRL